MSIRENVSLAPMTSWQIGGPAEFFVEPKSLEEIKAAIGFARERQLAVTVLGGGSNVLISDQGIEGLVICLRSFEGLSVQTDQGHAITRVEALSGTSKTELLKTFLKLRLAPAVFLAGIPGDVGGGVVMNAGIGEAIEPREFVDITEWIEVLRPDGTLARLQRDQLTWRYRHCEGWQPGLIVRVGLFWEGAPDPQIANRVRAANQVRHQRQPLHLPSCGSVFVNPEGAKSGALIESCGLKGFRIGDAQVSEKHGNFIVNLGAATAADTDAVIRHVQHEVERQTGYKLQTEVVYLGPWPQS